MMEAVKQEYELYNGSEEAEKIDCAGGGRRECSVCLAKIECMELTEPCFMGKDVLAYVGQHLDLDLELISVCHRCWNMLDEFHEFYEMVKRQHRKGHIVMIETSANNKMIQAPIQAATETERFVSMEFVEIKNEPLEANVSIKDEKEPFDDSFFADEISTTGEPNPTQDPDDGDTDSVTSLEAAEQKNTRTLRTKHQTNPFIKRSKSEPKLDQDILEFYKRLVCEVCDPQKMITGEPSIEYSNLKDLNRHMRKSHGQELGNVKCPMCEKKFRSRVKLLEHKDMHMHPDRFRCEVCKEIHQNMEEHMQNKHQEWTYCCEECGKRFPFKSRLTAHVRKMHTAKDVVCDQCQKPFSKYTIEDHKRAVHGASFMCEHCPRTFKTRFPLEQHMEEHIEGLRRAAAATCNICGIVVRNKYSLSTHIKRMHTEHPPVNCGSCGKVFKSKHNLDAHLANVCTDRSFPCSICGKQFKKKIKLKEHMTTHTKSALYQCQYCPKTFSFETQLYTHRKQAHYAQWLELQRKRKEGERFKVKRIAD